MKLILTMRKKGGSRRDVAFPVDKELKNNAALRAKTISRLQLQAEALVKNSRMADWRFEDGVIEAPTVLS